MNENKIKFKIQFKHLKINILLIKKIFVLFNKNNLILECILYTFTIIQYIKIYTRIIKYIVL